MPMAGNVTMQLMPNEQSNEQSSICDHSGNAISVLLCQISAAVYYMQYILPKIGQC